MSTAKISRLEAAAASVMQEVGRLQALNEDLRLQLAGLYLSWRALGEVRAHLAACSGASGGSSSGGSGAAALRAQLAIEGCIAEALGGRGGAEDGGGAAAAEDAARLVAPLLGHLKALAPGRCILHLEGITAEEVECYKTMDLPAFRKRWRALVAEARAAIARVDALNAQASVAPATGEAAGQQAEAPAEARARARAEARAALWDVGVRLSRTHHLLVLHAMPLFMRFFTAHMDTGELVLGHEDAPLSHWDAVVWASRFTRIQARLAVTMSTSHRTRLGAVHAQRAALCERLAAAGAQQPVAAATAAASADEVAASLEVNLRTEGFMFAAHNLSMVALGMPVLFARTATAAYPYPLSGPKFFAALAHMLKFEPDAFADEPED